MASDLPPLDLSRLRAAVASFADALAVVGSPALQTLDRPLRVLRELRDAFAELTLPFRVDLLQRRNASPDSLASIQRAGLVALPVPALTP